MREQVFAAVRKAIVTYGLIRPGDGVVVAVSGGADSVVLLHCLLRLRVEDSLGLHVAHFDHRMREGSERDARFVQELAASWNVPATTKSWEEKPRPGRSRQAEARRARYQFLEDLASQVGAPKIAVGHHRDDQSETVFLHLLRGSGLRGLRGMLAVRENHLIRPLLAVGREEIEGYAKAHQLSFIEDPSNGDVRYLRNRIRGHLLPLLQREYNPAIGKTLARMAAFIAEDEGYLEEVALEAFGRLLAFQEDSIAIELSSLRNLAPAIRRRVLERAIRTVAPQAYVTAAHLRAVERLIAPGGLSAVVLPHHQWAWRSGGLLLMGRWRQAGHVLMPQTLQVPGETVLHGWGMRLEATISPGSMADCSRGRGEEALIDWTQVLPPLEVRQWRPGDRFRPWGLRGSKKLQDLFVDAKIPREDREKIPVITDQKGILWVPGFRIDERGGIGAATAQVLVLDIHRGGATAAG